MFLQNIETESEEKTKFKNGKRRFFGEFFDYIHQTFLLVKNNLKAVVLFAFINLFISMFAVTFCADVFFMLLGKFFGINYIGNDNIKEVLLNPVAIVIGIIYFIALGCIIIFEIATLQHAFNESIRGKKATFSSMVSCGYSACVKLISPKNWLIIPCVVLILPFTGIMNLANSSLKVLIPSFIEDFLLASPVLSTLLISVYIILALLVFYHIHSINFFTLNDDDFILCCKKSKELSKKRIFKTILILLLFSISFHLVITAVSSTLASIVDDVSSRFAGDNNQILTRSSILAGHIQMIKQFLTGIALPIFNLAALSIIFFKTMHEEGRDEELSKESFKINTLKTLQKIIMFGLIIVIVAYNIVQIVSLSKFYATDSEIPDVIAHRGSSTYAPENTYPAFERAIYEFADGIELDVHETKDGVVMVSHDENLKRISGKDVEVHELTYAEIQQLDVGSWFSDKFKGLKLSTLDEVLKLYSDNDMTVQIEIKPTEFDHQLEEKIIELIKKYDMVDRCTVISLKAEPLKRIKELDPSIQTAFCMFVAWGDISKIDFSDAFSVEENNVKPYLVNKIHEAGKKCYAWTVNSEYTVQNLVDCGIDGILTDNPPMLQNALALVNTDGGIRKAVVLALYRIIMGY